MHVVVVGCGRVGSELAETLESQGHSVAIVDRDAKAFGRLYPGFHGLTVTGVGFDRDTLVDAGIERAGAFAAVTYGDNSNILCARIAHETFEVPNVVARIKDPRRALIFQRLGIPTVATVAWTTDQMMRRLLPGETSHEWIDPTGRVCLVERPLPKTRVGKKLAELNEPGRFTVSAVTRFGAAMLPAADTVGQEGDIIHFTCTVDAVDDLHRALAAVEGGHH